MHVFGWFVFYHRAVLFVLYSYNMSINMMKDYHVEIPLAYGTIAIVLDIKVDRYKPWIHLLITFEKKSSIFSKNFK